MSQPPSNNASLVKALYVNAGLLAAILVAILVSRDSGSMLPSAFAAQPAQRIAGDGSLFLMPAQFSTNSWGCYIMDTETQVLAAYTYDYGARKLNFQAARNFTNDRRMRDYNTLPHPSDVGEMLEKERLLLQQNNPTTAPAQ